MCHAQVNVRVNGHCDANVNPYHNRLAPLTNTTNPALPLLQPIKNPLIQVILMQ